jgi:hypothetical protein
MSAVLTHPEITPQRPHWLADDAVGCQPVSNPKFPANREINREICRFGRFAAILVSSRRANSKPCSEIPYTMEQGIFFMEQGILAQEQGISPAKTEIIAGRGFRYTQRFRFDRT